MKVDKKSFSALIVAHCRAYHATHDDQKIFDDYLAERLLTEEERTYFDGTLYKSVKAIKFFGSGKAVPSILKAFLPQRAKHAFKAVAPEELNKITDLKSGVDCYMHATGGPALTISRSRYTEDSLLTAVGKGIKQYVILGAGLDTFAFRHPEMMEKLRVFELDQPVTQNHKRQRISEQGWAIPKQLYFVPVDFTRQKLDKELLKSPYDPKSQSFFSWLGVTYYLDRETVLNALSTLASVAPKGSMIIFDYLDNDIYNPKKVAPRGQWLLFSMVGKQGKCSFDPAALSRDLAAIGLRLKENLSPGEIEKLYFKGHPGKYHAQEHAHFACAVVE